MKVFGSPGVDNLLGAVLFFFAVSPVSHKWLDCPVVECIERSWVRVSPAVILSMALMLIMVANIFETCVLCGKVLLCWLYNGSLLSPFALFMGAFWTEALSESCNNYTNNIIINNGKINRNVNAQLTENYHKGVHSDTYRVRNSLRKNGFHLANV